MSLLGGILGGIFDGILGGISASAQGKADKEMVKVKGTEDRKTLSHGAALEYYYKRLADNDKSVGLANYAKFNTIKQFAPTYVENAPAPMPQLPKAS